MEDSAIPPRFIDHPFEIIEIPLSSYLEETKFSAAVTSALNASNFMNNNYYRNQESRREKQSRQYVCNNKLRKEKNGSFYLPWYRRHCIHVL